MPNYYVATTGDDTNDGLTELTAWATPGHAAGAVVATSTNPTDQVYVYVKSGTYTCTTVTVNADGGPPQLDVGVIMEGYGTVPGDLGGDVIISSGGLAVLNWLCGTGEPGFNRNTMGYVNVTADGVDKSMHGFRAAGNYSALMWKCVAKNCSYGFDMTGQISLSECYAHDCTYGFKGGPDSSAYRCLARACWSGFYHVTKCLDCLTLDCTEHGFYCGTFTNAFVGCTSYNSTKSGFFFTYDMTLVSDCLSVGNGWYGFQFSGAFSSPLFIRNATYNNTLGETKRVAQVREHITLTADPFVNAVGDDFTLNDVSGGGAEIKRLSVAYKGSTILTQRHLGAVSQAIAGGGSGTQGFPASRLIG